MYADVFFPSPLVTLKKCFFCWQELLLYLLQLVQALKYENFNEIKNGEDILQCRKSLESPDLPSTPADKDR